MAQALDFCRQISYAALALGVFWTSTLCQGSAEDSKSHTATVESKSFAGRKTASGETYNPHAMVAASRTLPIGTKVKIKNRKTGKSVTVRINDKSGKNAAGAVDLSSAAAKQLGVNGKAPVDTKVVGSKAAH